MKFLMVLACALALSGSAIASDHGPVFSYATPVNSQGELSFDTGIFGRHGSSGTQFSTGSGFVYAGNWTGGAYYGSRGTFFADVTGDGRADAIVVNDNTVTVRRSDGNQFLPNEDWTHGAYYGSVGMAAYFADVTGDGRADAIVINDTAVTVRRAFGV